MEFALKIGDKFLRGIDCDDRKGRHSGCTKFITITGVKLNLTNEPYYFTSICIKSKFAEVIELMRWEDIPISEIRIIPK